MFCHDAVRHIARAAEDADLLDVETRAALEVHVGECADCRRALDDQRVVAALLRGRPQADPSPQFAARLAARLDDERGWFGMADWRRWSFRLAPVAAALWIGAFFGYAAASTSQAITIEEWTLGAADLSGAPAVLWQPDASTDVVLETILIGQEPESRGGADGLR